jgi:hypothetical protein
MAWTAPSTWTNGSVVTDTQLNQQLRDNMKYLHGDSGAIQLSDNLGVGAAPSGDRLLLSVSSGDCSQKIENLATSNNAAYQKFVRSTTGSARQWWQGVGINGSDEFSVYDQTAAAIRLLINSGGNVGLGTSSPQGRLHGYDTIGGFLHWKYDGVDGTLRTIIPDGAGDVLYYATGIFQARTSGGNNAITSTIGLIAPGAGGQDFYNNGGNILHFDVAANGSVTVQRTGGALTYKVNLWLLWM